MSVRKIYLKSTVDTLFANTEAYKIASQVYNAKTGMFRASKPSDGCAAYVWRMLGFYLGASSQLMCMPMTADFGIEVPEVMENGRWSCKKCSEYTKNVLDPIVDMILKSLPDIEKKGIYRWQKAFGMI
jgi:hypothetical protein